MTDKNTFLLDIDFSAADARNHIISGTALTFSADRVILTAENDVSPSFKSGEFQIDRDPGSLFAAEWSFTPEVIGNYTSDFALDCNIFSVDLIPDQAPYLNGFIRARGDEPGRKACELKAGCQVKMRCEFNALGIFSWQVNGEEQLTAPVAAKDHACAGKTRIVIGRRDDIPPEYSPLKQQAGCTRWHYVRISRVPGDDPLLRKVKGFELYKRQERAAFMVGNSSTMTRLRLEPGSFQGKISDTIQLSGAGRETVSTQLAVIPLNKDIDGVSLDISALHSADKRTEIPAENLKWFQLGYVKVNNNRLDDSEYGHFYPDILLPGKKFSVKSNVTRALWLDITIPDGTPAGKYYGIITVSSDNGGCRMLKIELLVRAFSLPLRSRLVNAFAVNPGVLERCYAPEKSREIYGKDTDKNFDKMYNLMGDAPLMGKEFWKNYCDFVLAYRLNPVSIYSDIMIGGKYRVIPDQELLQYCYDKGMNALCLMCIRDIPREPDAQKNYLDEVKKHLNNWKKIIDRLDFKDFTWYIHAFDESELAVGKKEYFDYAINTVCVMIKKEFPWVKIETANRFIERHAGKFDIWTPKTFELPPPEKRMDKTFWTYVCCGPNHPYANFFIDYDGVCARILPWQIFQAKVKGFLYYLINREITAKDWETDENKPFTFLPVKTEYLYTNGDGLLMYPGADGEFFASVRMANLRNGLQDHDAWAMLAERLEKSSSDKFIRWRQEAGSLMQKLNQQITRSFVDYTRNPELLESTREQLQYLIEQFEIIKGA